METIRIAKATGMNHSPEVETGIHIITDADTPRQAFRLGHVVDIAILHRLVLGVLLLTQTWASAALALALRSTGTSGRIRAALSLLHLRGGTAFFLRRIGGRFLRGLLNRSLGLFFFPKRMPCACFEVTVTFRHWYTGAAIAMTPLTHIYKGGLHHDNAHRLTRFVRGSRPIGNRSTSRCWPKRSRCRRFFRQGHHRRTYEALR